MTLEQERALALARARVRMGQTPQAEAPQAEAPQAEPPVENTWGQELGRQAGLTGRAAANVLASPATLPLDLLYKGINTVAGKEVVEPSTRVLGRALTAAGFPEPREGVETTAQQVAQSAPSLAIPGGFMPQVAGNAMVGAVQAPPGEEFSGATKGALGAGFGHAIPQALGQGLPGISKAARKLMDTSSVQPTVGMAVPKLAAAEEFVTGMPVVGEFAKNARARAIGEFSDEALQKAVPGFKLPKGSPQEKLDFANDYVDTLYHDILPRVQPEVPSVAMGATGQRAPLTPSRQAFDRGYAAAKSNNYLTDAQQEILDRVYKARADDLPGYTGEQLKTLDAELGEQIRKYQRGAGTSDLGDSLRKLQQGLREGIEARLLASEQGKLATANRAYRELIPVNEAASRAATKDFSITPGRLSKAIAARDKKPISRLTGDLADFATTGQQVLPESIRHGISSPGLATALLGGGGAVMTGNLPAAIASTAALAGGSTRGAQAALLGNTQLQKALRSSFGREPKYRAIIGAQLMPDSDEE